MRCAMGCNGFLLKLHSTERGFDMQIEFYIVVLLFACMAIVVLDDIVSKR